MAGEPHHASVPPAGARSAASLLLTAAVVTLGLPTGAAAQAPQKVEFKVGGVALKTKPADGQRIAPLIDALERFDRDQPEGAERGRPLERLTPLADRAKAEVRTFTRRLETNGEVDSFDELVRTQAEKTGPPELLSELAKAGGAWRVLADADRQIDAALLERRESPNGTGKTGLLDLLRPKPAWAAAPRPAVLCGLFWYTISLGYGTAHAYRSCYY